MSTEPPDDPPGPALPQPEEPPRRPNAVTVALGIVVGVAAVLGAWTLVGAGICVAVGGRIGG
jgi:hypothetical protein